jgi:hypothetical protein
MSNQQHQQHYYGGDHNTNAQDEVDAMLNSLVGQTRPGGSYSSNPSYHSEQQYNNNVSLYFSVMVLVNSL